MRPAETQPVAVAALAAAAGLAVPVDTGPAITGMTLRAGDARPGDLFAALPGARAHGADFVATALAAGAVAVLTDPAGADQSGLQQVRDGGLPTGPGDAEDP